MPSLLLALFFCHFLADYTHLSTSWMLAAKRVGSPLIPILMHALVHAFLMGIAIAIIHPVPEFFLAGLLSLQWLSHFIIDVLKGKCNVWFPSLANPANKFHWYIFGFDQFLHAAVIIKMIYWIEACGL